MPAASVKVEKQPAIGEVTDVQKQLQLFVDKKIRNLEKRKVSWIIHIMISSWLPS